MRIKINNNCTWILIAITLLTGCSSMKMNNSFSCGVGEGLGCKSVSEVSEILDSSSPTNVATGKKTEPQYFLLNYYEGISADTLPERAPEKRLKIWFASHIDAYDNLVEETVVYTVIKDSRWVF